MIRWDEPNTSIATPNAVRDAPRLLGPTPPDGLVPTGEPVVLPSPMFSDHAYYMDEVCAALEMRACSY